tara:strand:+ start:6405 stop:6551 length:147 start_codon:yes stop_codon:yes gene_type:complete
MKCNKCPCELNDLEKDLDSKTCFSCLDKQYEDCDNEYSDDWKRELIWE